MLRYLSKKSEGHFAPSMTEVYLALYDGGWGISFGATLLCVRDISAKKEFCTRCRKQIMIGDLSALEHIEL